MNEITIENISSNSVYSSINIQKQQQSSNAFELDEQGGIARPEMLATDWVELLLLSLLLIFGLPLNAIALIILCYCPSHIAWLIGYTWSAGEFLCKAMQYSWYFEAFFSDFCFHLMSFGVLSISLDRLRTVYGLMRMEKTGKMAGGVASQQIRPGPLNQSRLQRLLFQRLILICYIAAALVSVPQWFVWTTIDMRSWSQCTTVWHKRRAIEYIEGSEPTESFTGEKIYTLLHLLTVFWLPFLGIFAAYVYIVLFLFLYSLRPSTSHPSTTSFYSSTAAESSAFSQPSYVPPLNSVKLNRSSISNYNSTLLVVPNLSKENSSFWPTESSVSPVCNLNGGDSTITNVASPLCAQTSRKHKVPAWRLEMRSRIFQTTIHVIAAYLLCWMPYNVLALATFFSRDLQITISVHLELLRICVLLNTLLNPFIYGFKKSQS
ncbi:G_PROTEIN_RECEP_F1_2 domain-containing protein [Meloidogyne graminicola]|uniref:G_PROTEIN_RECEP_F1_2 domain-containing protein n=1 Tax=Meloidogyne graminicola TaxID=189291 RepID=A0A8S9ZHU8_9BILA|nr:G_PROTEIN_RECEP_F1_2 domain-containing protein [Meloidogyne graminicola]